MPKNNKKSHARISYMPLVEPNPNPDSSVDREKWLREAAEGFVSPSRTNKEYYQVILKTLWPKGHGIPGPLVEEAKLRRAIDEYRGKPYVDTFRRVRELQGEEGFLGIVKGGNKYQLIHTTISSKRILRIHLKDSEWNAVLSRYQWKCAVCGRSPRDKRFQQDHKIPRLRGGGDDLDNWQPLCDECNNFKSTACRDCQLNCGQCSWAYPEKYKPFHIPGDLIQRLRAYAERIHKDPNEIVISLIENELEKEKVHKEDE